MNKRRIIFEVTIDDINATTSARLSIDVMTAVFNGISAARLASDVRIILLEDKAVFEGVVAKAVGA